jgi:hypothetical protein
MNDWRLLAWLRWRQWRGSALYWLRSVGYDPNQQSLIDRMYALYLLALGVIWVLMMAAWAFYQAASIGAHLTASLVDTALARGVPWLVLGLAVVVMVLNARSTPLKLSFADMAYVAGSPVSRRSAVLVNYVQEVIQALVLLVPMLALAVAALAQALGQETARWAAVRAAVVVLPQVALALAAAWCLGLLYLAAPRLKRFPLSWLLPVLLLAGGYLLPGVFLWPGRTLAAAIPGPVPVASVIALAVLAALAVAGLARIGLRTNMVDVADESAVFARINALGLMAWLAPDVAQRIRRQAALARRKPFLRLPSLPGPAGLVARSALTYLRRPLSLLGLVAWGFATALAGSALVFRGAGILLWLFGLTVLLLIPPPGLVDAFRSDLREPFLRQFLPANNLSLLAADVAPSLLLVVIGGLAGWLLQPVTPEGAAQGALLVVVMAAVLALAQGASHVVLVFDRRVPYAVWAGLSIGATAITGLATASPDTATITASFAALVLALSIAGSPGIVAER